MLLPGPACERSQTHRRASKAFRCGRKSHCRALLQLVTAACRPTYGYAAKLQKEEKNLV